MSTSNHQPVLEHWASQPEHLRRMVDFIDRFTARVVERLQKFESGRALNTGQGAPKAISG
jgi:hypothetical protein